MGGSFSCSLPYRKYCKLTSGEVSHQELVWNISRAVFNQNKLRFFFLSLFILLSKLFKQKWFLTIRNGKTVSQVEHKDKTLSCCFLDLIFPLKCLFCTMKFTCGLSFWSQLHFGTFYCAMIKHFKIFVIKSSTKYMYVIIIKKILWAS